MLRKILRSRIASMALLAAAVALILGGGIGGARAALRETSDEYVARIKMQSIDVVLLENGKANYNELMLDLLPTKPDGKKEALVPGKAYDEELMVQNNGTIDQYVRVTVYKYWTSKAADGTMSTAADRKLDPSYIQLNLEDALSKGWVIDKAASTKERTVLYYTSIVSADGGTTNPFNTTVTISKAVAEADQATGEYPYEGAEFHVEAVVDAVQTHNADMAMTGAWGQTYGQAASN